MGELTNSIDAKIAEFLAELQAIQRGDNCVRFCMFCSFSCLGSLAMFLLSKLNC